jgi:hypothetical protein
VVIGIWPLLLTVDQSSESCIDKANADQYNANKLKPLRSEFYDLNGDAILHRTLSRQAALAIELIRELVPNVGAMKTRASSM